MRIYEPSDIPKEFVTLDIETTGLEPETYILTAVGIGRSPGDVEVRHIETDEEEPKLIQWIREKLSSYRTKNVVCWNGRFDFRFVRTRAMINGLLDPLRGYEMIDDLVWFKKFTRMTKHSLDHVANSLDLGAKVGRGHEMPRLYYKRKYDELVRHCRRDVELTIKVHEKILETVGKKAITQVENISSEKEIPEITEKPKKEE